MTSTQTPKSLLPADAGWYLFHRHDCHGPFTRSQVVTLISNKRINASWMIMREGWTEWRSLVDCLGELANGKTEAKPQEQSVRVGAPRANIRAAITAGSHHARTKGQSRNISVSGIFISTSESPFRLGEQVNLHVHAVELKAPFDVRAEVTRFNSNRTTDVGYGLRFIDLASSTVVDIARLVGYRPTQAFGEIVYSFPFNRPAPTKKR